MRYFPYQLLDLYIYCVYTAQAHQKATDWAREKLRVPPILPEREEKGKLLEENSQLDQFDSSNWVFTDISTGLKASVCKYV